MLLPQLEQMRGTMIIEGRCGHKSPPLPVVESLCFPPLTTSVDASALPLLPRCVCVGQAHSVRAMLPLRGTPPRSEASSPERRPTPAPAVGADEGEPTCSLVDPTVAEAWPTSSAWPAHAAKTRRRQQARPLHPCVVVTCAHNVCRFSAIVYRAEPTSCASTPPTPRWTSTPPSWCTSPYW